jgi:PadR family transcriptional regulator PadR
LPFDKRSGIFLSKLQGSTKLTDRPSRVDLPQGTLDLLILKAIALGPQHGWAISERIHQISRDVLKVQQGSLYPALHRLERRGWIKAEWGASDNNRRAKYYELTRAGRKQLEAQADAWRTLTVAVSLLLDTP